MAIQNQTCFAGEFPRGILLLKPLKKQTSTNIGGFWIYKHLRVWRQVITELHICLISFMITTEGMNVPSALKHFTIYTFPPLHLKFMHGHLSLPLLPAHFLVPRINCEPLSSMLKMCWSMSKSWLYLHTFSNCLTDISIFLSRDDRNQ